MLTVISHHHMESKWNASNASVYLRNWKSSSIEDRGQADRVTALRRPYALDIDL